MLYYSINSKKGIVHFENCCHAKRIKAENRRSFRDIHEAHENGYSMCPCCSPVSKKIKKEKTSLISFCQKNGIAFLITNDTIHIHTSYSEWKIVPWDNKHRLRFYHENTSKGKEKQDILGYHRQKFSADTLMEYFQYIASHEEYRLNQLEEAYQAKLKKARASSASKKARKIKNAHSRRNRSRKAWQVIHLIDAVCQPSRCLEM